MEDEHVRTELTEICNKYREVFRLTLHRNGADYAYIRVNVQDGVTTRMKGTYTPRLNSQQRDLIDQQVIEMIKNHVIEPSHSGFTSPLLVLPKPSGGWRCVVDFKILNSKTIPFRFPVPRPFELIESMSGYKVFGLIDIRAAFWQLKVHPDDRKWFAFNTTTHQYKLSSLPMGWINSGAEWMHTDLIAATKTDMSTYSKSNARSRDSSFSGHYDHSRHKKQRDTLWSSLEPSDPRRAFAPTTDLNSKTA